MSDETKQLIKKDYDGGAYSPLQLAFKHNVEISDVYTAIEMTEMLNVQIVGDQVDNAGPGVAINPGTAQQVNYTKN